MFTKSSIKKLTPIKLKINAGIVISSVKKYFKKNINTPSINTPVLTIGQEIAEIATASVLFLFFNTLKMIPATRPDIAPFTSTVIIVPGTDNAKNGPASPDTKTAIPNTNPNHVPPFHPKRADPITIGTSYNVIENVPVLMKILMYCKTNVTAVSTAYITKFLVDIAFLFTILNSIAFLPTGIVFKNIRLTYRGQIRRIMEFVPMCVLL
jgi:hypothetical protein